MPTTTIFGGAVLTAMECPVCGVVYGLNERMRSHAEERGNSEITWYCTNGHSLVYPGKSEAQKLRAKLNRAEATNTHLRDQRDATERSRRALKGQVTKVKNRVAKGVCPCCNRSFPDLHAHMQTKHPDYAPTEGA
jgi:hypothetical protein